MSTESERIHSASEAIDGTNASRIEIGNDQMSETLAEPLTGQVQELEAKRDGDEQQGRVTVEEETSVLASADDEFTDLTKETESVNGGLDLGIETPNVDVETKENVEKVLADSKDVLMVKDEKDSDGIQTEELLVEKEVEPDMSCSHETNLSDIKGSDVTLNSEDGKPDGSGEQESKVENLDDDNLSVTAELKLSDSDLVWAKVRSHPWWPGQVFDTSAATEKAKKYSKKGSFLVTYFGDCTFAWNDASRLKPFRQHFSQMSKQSSLPDFIDAIDFALEEVSRRIEFGLACSCISEDVYEQIKVQNIINPGILEDSSHIHGGDKVSSAIFFKPVNLVEYVKGLACSPIHDTTDELQFVSRRAELLAFNRWKGYIDLPEFETLQGSVESASKISPAEEKSDSFEVKISVPEPKKAKQVYTKRKKTEEQDDCKDDAVFEYEDTVPKKKEKTLAEFIAEKRSSKSKGNKSNEKSAIKPDSEKKRKIVNPKLPKSVKKVKANVQTEDPGSSFSPKTDRKHNSPASNKITPEKTRTSFGIGASILRVANQMHCSTPTELKQCSNSTFKMAAKNNSNGKSLKDKPKAEALSQKEISPSPNEPHSSPATKTPNGKANLISIDPPQSGELDGHMEDSSKDQMVIDDREEAANVASEISIEESDRTEEKLSGSDLKEQSGNKNRSDGRGGLTISS